MPFEATIADFAAALANPAASAPAGTVGRLALPDSSRFSVYRNNVAIGLIAALEARYPVTRRIVGDAVFRAMARSLAHARKPRSPVIIAYGDDFPDFISNAAEELDLPYLVDVARLENAWVEAYHAEDAKVAVIDDLLAIPSDELPEARVELHPAARLLRFATPAASIWAARQGDAPPCPPEHWQGEDALVVRPEADVSVHILPPDGYAFAARLRDGATLADAAGALSNPDAFGAHVVGLIGAGAIASIIPASLTRNPS
jgi:hypothetical protein